MDHASRLRRGVALVYGPCAHFLHAGREIGLQAQQLVTGADQAVKAGFFQAEVGEELLFVGLLQVRQFGFNLRAQRHDRRAFFRRMLAQAIQMRIVFEAVFQHVADIHRRLDGKQAQRFDELLFFVAQTECTGRLAFVQVGQQPLQHGHQFLRILVAGLGLLAVALDGALHHGKVGQRQFGEDDFDVGDRVDLARHVHHVGIVETAHDVDDGIGLADVGKELVTQAFTLGGARDQARDVDELDNGRLHALRIDDLSQLGHARIRHLDDADVGLDGAEGIILRRDARLGERIEQRGFAHVGETDDTAFETHVFSLY